MKSEFVVSKIEAYEDEKTPFVYIVFSDTKLLEEEINSNRHLEVQVWLLHLKKILMKNLPKMFGGGTGFGDSPTFKLSIREYDESGLRVGDKVTIEIKKSDISGL